MKKRPSDGEAGRFTSITPNGDAHDPRQSRPKSDTSGIVIGGGASNPYGGRSGSWGQFERGEKDDAGGQHDW